MIRTLRIGVAIVLLATVPAGAEDAPMTPQQALEAGKSYGRANNPIVPSKGTGDSANTVHPGYDEKRNSTVNTQGMFNGGMGNLFDSSVNKANTCSTATPDPDNYKRQECEGINFLWKNPQKRPQFTIGSNDPLLQKEKSIRESPELNGASVSGAYSDCQEKTEPEKIEYETLHCEEGRTLQPRVCDKFFATFCASNGACGESQIVCCNDSWDNKKSPMRINITASTSNFNVANALNTYYSPYCSTEIILTIEAGVTIYSTDARLPAFDTGILPAGTYLTVINRGIISGRGGNGGRGAGGSSGGGSWNHSVDYSNSAGQDGGNAMEIRQPITLDNSGGIIRGGGGGGGGGGVALIWSLVKTGGGGGGGSGGGTGGTTDSTCQGPEDYACTPQRCGGRGTNGQDGSLTAPGDGGAGSGSSNWIGSLYENVDQYDQDGNYLGQTTVCTANSTGYGAYSGGGGRGGDWGQPGYAGTGGGVWGWCGCSGDNYAQGGGAAGGGGGRAIRTNGYTITWSGGNNASQVVGGVQ